MKHLITLLAVTFIFTASFAENTPAKFIAKPVAVKSTLTVTLQATGKIAISWDAVAETTTTAYKIEKSVNGGEFKTVAYLMGETLATYTYKDKVNGVSGNITYRVVTSDNNTVVNAVSQTLVVL
jgi:hypothetical protein